MLQSAVTKPEDVQRFLQEVLIRVNGVLSGSIQGCVVNATTFEPTSDRCHYLVFTIKDYIDIVVHTRTNMWKIQVGANKDTLILVCEFSTDKLEGPLKDLLKQYRRLFQQKLKNLPRSGDSQTEVSKLMDIIFAERPLAGLE